MNKEVVKKVIELLQTLLPKQGSFESEFEHDGLLWSKLTKEKFTFEEAEEYAKSKGHRLPKASEIMSVLEEDPRLLKGERSFWSGSVYPKYPSYAYYFDGENGGIGWGNQNNSKSARLVKEVE